MPHVTLKPIAAEDTLALRHSVLWPDKPFDYVRLPDDADGFHLGGFVDGELVSVISLFIAESDATTSRIARFRKFATAPAYQGRGIGTQLLNHVIEHARQRGATHIWCDARLTAAGFYERFGMQAEGDVFHKGPIPYSRFGMAL
ncbi:GNAT family N-acetyltransferase [Rudanella paleaurantiibacter]|uniref:GNAT family N-acetyltransferase n=1 Tax=Rudanella paleaurantiibacter TaxID=2614655 RepID=A0A7J5TVT7_9BACT|nr:GNAT family N-acetyltransferase [Rudanella paleaurantiibacter]KAB7728407.1 GNAT family N-acetyltransferase [Rudanella paleaurantiibacter]